MMLTGMEKKMVKATMKNRATDAFDRRTDTGMAQHSTESTTNEPLEPDVVAPAPPSDPAHEEHQYLNLIREILAEGEHRPDR